MLNRISPKPGRQAGDTLLEVLVALVVVAFGMLGFAGFVSKIELTEMETHQRAQASALLEDMADRIRSASAGNNFANAENYVSGETVGTGDGQPESCPDLDASATPADIATHDICEWSSALKGAAEKQSSTNVGGMIGARACIIQVQAPNATAGVCTPGIYQVTIAWQGLSPTKAPEDTAANNCGGELYGDEKLRRVLSERIALGLPACN